MLSSMLTLLFLMIGSVECFHCPHRHMLKSLPPRLYILKSSSLRSSVNDNYGDHHYGGEQRGSSYMSNHAKRDLMERRQVKRFHQMASMDRPQGRDFPPQSYPSRPYPSPEGMRRPPEPPMQQQQQQQQQQMESFNQDVSASLKAMTEILKEVKNSQKVQSLDVELLSKRCDDMANRLSRTESKNRRMMEETKSSNPFGESLDGNFNDNVKDFVVDKSTEDYVDEIDDLKAEINRLVDTMRLTEDKLELKMESVYQRLNNENPPMDDDPSMPFGDDVQRQFQPQPPPMPAPLESVPPVEDPFYDQNSYYSDRNAPYTGDMASDRKFASLSLTRSANDKKSGYRYEQQPQNQSFISALSKSELTDRRMSGFGLKPPLLQNQQPPPGEMFPRQFPPQYYEEPFMYEEPYFYEEEPFMGEFFGEGEPYYY